MSVPLRHRIGYEKNAPSTLNFVTEMKKVIPRLFFIYEIFFFFVYEA